MFKNLSLVTEASRLTEMKSKDEAKVHFKKASLSYLESSLWRVCFPTE